MLRNYIKVAFRNLKRFKGYTVINLFGLALGLSVATLILLFVTDELAFDKFHAKKDRIFRVLTRNPSGGTMETNAWPVAAILKDEYPEVEKVVYSLQAPASFMINFQNKDYEHNLHYAGEDFFQIFSFEFLEGNPESALEKPYQIVITKAIKDKYFGSELAVGKTVMLRDSLEFEVTGVIDDVVDQSHIQFEMLASFKTYEQLTNGFSYSGGFGWGMFNVRNYILLKEGTDVSQLQAKVQNLYMDRVGDWLNEMGMEFQVGLEPLSDTYLYSTSGNGFGPQGSIDRVYLVTGIAIFVLLLACINFINLTTARSIYRAKEVGVRKIVGSSKRTLIAQFMSEALLLTLIAMFLAAILVDLALPFFNELMGKSYDINSLIQFEIIGGVLALVFLVTLLSGYYPSIVLSGYQPVDVLKGNMHTSSKGVMLRRGLVVFQFFISGALVLATFTVISQLNFMRNQNLGFDKDQVLVLDVTRVPNDASYSAFQTAISQISTVESVSFNNALPGRPGWQGQWAYPEKVDPDRQVDTEYMAVDEHYLATLGLELIAGENFDPSKNMDDALLINEVTVKEMGWKSPEEALGKRIVSPSDQPSGLVIGVVKNYHGQGLQDEIWPKVMEYTADQFGRYYAIRFATGSTSEVIDQTRSAWKEYLGDSTFDYSFLDQDFDRQYKSEDRLMTVFIVFALMTLIIAVIGLLGLVSFMVLTKMKEIGIRKVLGANVIGLAGRLSKEFTLLVLLANILVIPVVWYYGQQWLNDFAYHTNLNPVLFLISMGATLFIAIGTVSYQTIRAAQANPIDTLQNQ